MPKSMPPFSVSKDRLAHCLACMIEREGDRARCSNAALIVLLPMEMVSRTRVLLAQLQEFQEEDREAIDRLIDAFGMVERGIVNWFFQPIVKMSAQADERRRRLAELIAVMGVDVAQGEGQAKGVSQEAVGSLAALRKWEPRVRHYFGEQRVDYLRLLAKEVGRCRLKGQGISPDNPFAKLGNYMTPEVLSRLSSKLRARNLDDVDLEALSEALGLTYQVRTDSIRTDSIMWQDFQDILVKLQEGKLFGWLCEEWGVILISTESPVVQRGPG
jgi:hypothetical protein